MQPVSIWKETCRTYTLVMEQIIQRILYVKVAKGGGLRFLVCNTKYSRHIESVIMRDGRGSIKGNHNDFTMSPNLYYLSCY